MKKITGKKKANDFRCLRHEECTVLGYCVLAKQREISKQYLESTYNMSDDYIKELVPQKVETADLPYHIGEYSRVHLQTAFDAYHQKDYETAILHCKAVITENFSCRIAYICIISSEYFMGNLEEATYFSTKVEELYHNDEEKRFFRFFNLHCHNILQQKTKSQESIGTKSEKTPVQKEVVCYL